MAFENGSRVMNGTFGTVWADGSEIAEISAFQLKVTKNWDPINLCGQMAEDRKLTGIKITGSMTLHKVYSRGAEDVNAAAKGHDVRRTLVAKLADPDAYGAGGRLWHELRRADPDGLRRRQGGKHDGPLPGCRV